MWLWMQNNIGCYRFHEFNVILFLRYHGIKICEMVLMYTLEIHFPIGFPSLYLEVSSVYGSTTNIIHIVLKCKWILCMFVLNFGLMKCFQVKSYCNELLPLPFETIFEMSQSLPLVGQPSVIGHVCMVIIGHNTLATSHLLIYDKHMVYENN